MNKDKKVNYLLVGLFVFAACCFAAVGIISYIGDDEKQQVILFKHVKHFSINNKHDDTMIVGEYQKFRGHTYLVFMCEDKPIESMTVVHDPDCPKCQRIKNEKRSEN